MNESIQERDYYHYNTGIYALLFVLIIPIYYNASALIHAVWYLVLSALGVLNGLLMLLLKKRICTL